MIQINVFWYFNNENFSLPSTHTMQVLWAIYKPMQNVFNKISALLKFPYLHHWPKIPQFMNYDTTDIRGGLVFCVSGKLLKFLLKLIVNVLQFTFFHR